MTTAHAQIMPRTGSKNESIMESATIPGFPLVTAGEHIEVAGLTCNVNDGGGKLRRKIGTYYVRHDIAYR